MNINKIRPFQRIKLNSLSFGKLEGEQDDFLKESFYCTPAIKEAIKHGQYNYIYSPKGMGKSALYTAIINNYLPSSIFQRSKYSIVGLNQAFGMTDSPYLETENFKADEKSTSLNWGFYLLFKLINDIVTNHNDKNNFQDFYKKIKNIEKIKEHVSLNNVRSLLKTNKIKAEFKVMAGLFSFTPEIELQEVIDTLDINELFSAINEFYRKNNLTALILVDRLDNFVSKESYVVQKHYIQGLMDCIEEIHTFSNIHPMLFIRTDLFYVHDIAFEFDKVKDRQIQLIWEKDDIKMFLALRFLKNKYIYDNYGKYLKYCNNIGSHTSKNYLNNCIQIFRNLFKSENQINYELSQAISFNSAERFFKLFLPSIIKHDKPKEEEIIPWIFEKMMDSNKYVNLRLLISFLNQLCIFQSKEDVKNLHIVLKSKEEVVNINGYYNFQLFSNTVVISVYEKMQKDSLITINKMLKNKEAQLTFLEIVNAVKKNQTYFIYESIDYKNNGLSKEEYEALIKYLKLLGYCEATSKFRYEVRPLFRSDLVLN